ncbi:hypothetical protein FB451DRAFT_1169422 [Mycena latifolia]|nr:hypothetical protein FB451DRAFT_1169422 [Mycena latifolia]
MGSHQFWSRSPAEYATYFRYFASLKYVRSFPPTDGARISTNQPRSVPPLVRSVADTRASSGYAGVQLEYSRLLPPTQSFRESKFWAEYVVDGEDMVFGAEAGIVVQQSMKNDWHAQSNDKIPIPRPTCLTI